MKEANLVLLSLGSNKILQIVNYFFLLLVDYRETSIILLNIFIQKK